MSQKSNTKKKKKEKQGSVSLWLSVAWCPSRGATAHMNQPGHKGAAASLRTKQPPDLKSLIVVQ